MLWTVFLGATAVLCALPAGAAERTRGLEAGGLAPITLAEATASGLIAQRAEPPPPEPSPAAAPAATTPKPAPSPWGGTLEIYGFSPLRATTAVTRDATERDLPGLLDQRGSERNLDLGARRSEDLRALRPDLSFPERRPGRREKRAEQSPSDDRTQDSGRQRPNLSFPDSIEIPGFTAITDVGLGSLLEHLTDIYALRGSVEYHRIGFQTDLSYVGLSAQTAKSFQRERRFFPDLPVPTRTLKTQLAMTQGIYDFALRYRFGERERAISSPGAVVVIPYAGVRVVDLGLETTSTFQGPLLLRSRAFSFGHPIAQPLVGLQGQVFLTSRLRLFARGDLGGFGSNGTVDMSGNAQAGVGFAIGNSTQLDLSWRYLYLARDNGETPKTAYAIDQNGIEVGIKFFF